MLLAAGSLRAQDRQLTGSLADEQNQPVVGANVVIKGTTRGTTSDAAGTFPLSIPNGSTVLVISSVGYTAKDVTVSAGQSQLTVTLDNDDRLLGEVVVTALGIRKEAKSLIRHADDQNRADQRGARRERAEHAAGQDCGCLHHAGLGRSGHRVADRAAG